MAAVMASAISPEQAPVLSLTALGGEFLLGVVMAFGFHAAHAGLDMAGKLIDTQIGLNAAGVFDPGTSTVTGLIAELLALGFALGATPVSAADVAQGKAVAQVQCVQCHEADDWVGEDAASLESLIRDIAAGKVKHKTKITLTPEQIAAVAAYWEGGGKK